MDISDDYRRGRHVVSVLHVHVVFVTKYRRGVFDEAMLDACERTMRDVCADFGARLVAFNGEDDHAHLLVEHPPKVAVSALVNSLKGVPGWMPRAEFTGRVNHASMRGRFRSLSYFAGSTGGARIALSREYIEGQRRPAPMR
ncbi:putative transposase [Parafrankia irregularis]|uniref:Putative transposase n=1 Tax=Parafrankia irregularis TaxID=795642 RepID=A0A0S4QQB3_9ACTN|nr:MULTISPECIES: IS200/IS605 family transposase [Parafrankia]MBE3204338.1 IS200/IS605 family transposase [Parafrankia sp. CH37]CUU57311.1 putative transposase [Parafrankia irregularis]